MRIKFIRFYEYLESWVIVLVGFVVRFLFIKWKVMCGLFKLIILFLLFDDLNNYKCISVYYLDWFFFVLLKIIFFIKKNLC